MNFKLVAPVELTYEERDCISKSFRPMEAINVIIKAKLSKGIKLVGSMPGKFCTLCAYRHEDITDPIPEISSKIIKPVKEGK